MLKLYIRPVYLLRPEEEVASLSLLVAVSYTHLDVYKRQVYNM